MPYGTAELPILYRGCTSTTEASPSPGSAPTSPSLPVRAPQPTHSHQPHDVTGSLFSSVLRFLHIESGLAATTPPTKDDKTTSTPSGQRPVNNGVDFDDGTGGLTPNEVSARSFTALSENTTVPIEAQPEKKKKKKHGSSFGTSFASLFFKDIATKKRSKTKPTPSHGVAAPGSVDDVLASLVILEGDEDDERADVMQVEDAIYNVLVGNFHSELRELRERTIWNAEKGGEVSDEQMHTIYYMLFRQMKALLAQQFSHIFPHGIHGTSLTMPDVASCVAGLCLIEMAITDDDIHSFAFSIFPGRRISLDNCPPTKRYLYFMFMAFKATVPMFRSHMDQFRSAVVRYFYDRNSIKAAGQLVVLPLQALLQAMAPILCSPHFQKMTPTFYYHALQLERERRGVTDSEASHWDSTKENEAGEPTEEEPLLTSRQASQSPAPASTSTRARGSSGARRSHGQHYSTIAQAYTKTKLLGSGAYGTVFQCVDRSNGVVYALKEISLLTSTMKHRIYAVQRQHDRLRQQQQQQQQIADGQSPDDQGSDASPSTPSLKLNSILTERDKRELHSREAAIIGEINMLKALRNPHIVSYYGCSFDPKTMKVSILMEYCSKTLRDNIEEIDIGTGLPLKLIAHYAYQVLQGLTFLHDNHVVHRDIKAANILVNDAGEAKVSDFGTAMLNEMHNEEELESLRRQASADDDEDLRALFQSAGGGTKKPPAPGGGSASSRSKGDRSTTFTIQGTPLFLAPEVANGCLPTEASDIWSFGCLLIEMASGKYPWSEWTGDNILPTEMILYHISEAKEPPKLPEDAAPHAASSPEFLDLLQSCLAIDPIARPSARQLAHHAFFKLEHYEPLVAASTLTDEVEVELDPDGPAGGANVLSMIPNESLFEAPSED